MGGVFRPRQEDTGGLCSGDCIQVISQDCGETEWAYLTNIVSQLRGIGILDLPSLVQLEDCNETANADKEPDCFSSLTGKSHFVAIMPNCFCSLLAYPLYSYSIEEGLIKSFPSFKPFGNISRLGDRFQQSLNGILIHKSLSSII